MACDMALENTSLKTMQGETIKKQNCRPIPEI